MDHDACHTGPVTFYSSSDLKNWTKESAFGQSAGAHGGVWECPDLFSFNANGEKIWVLLVSINPGGPNGGSATQYFTGRFNGTTFMPFSTGTKWIDYGPDDYAGVTWSNTGDRRLFIGWMSNWQYGQLVPTKTWRSAMTVPRQLRLEKSGEDYLLLSQPVKELDAITEKPTNVTDALEGSFSGPVKLQLTASAPTEFTLALSNKDGQQVIVGYDKASNTYFIDRTASGNTGFEKGFATRHKAPRLSTQKQQDLTLLIDQSSVELFADSGRTVMTEIAFPDGGFTNFHLKASEKKNITQVQISNLQPSRSGQSVAKQQ